MKFKTSIIDFIFKFGTPVYKLTKILLKSWHLCFWTGWDAYHASRQRYALFYLSCSDLIRFRNKILLVYQKFFCQIFDWVTKAFSVQAFTFLQEEEIKLHNLLMLYSYPLIIERCLAIRFKDLSMEMLSF